MNLQLPPISAVAHSPDKAPPKATAPLEGECDMFGFEALIVVIILGVIGLALSARTVKQYERGWYSASVGSGKTSADRASR